MYQESQIVDLLMAVVLTPVMIAGVRALRLPGKRWFVLGYVAMMVGYVLSVVARRFAPDAFTLLEHAAYVVSGVGFAGGTWSMLVDVRGRRPA